LVFCHQKFHIFKIDKNSVRIEIKTIVLTFQKLAWNKKLQAAQIYRKAISPFLLDSSLQNGKFLLKEKKNSL